MRLPLIDVLVIVLALAVLGYIAFTVVERPAISATPQTIILARR